MRLPALFSLAPALFSLSGFAPPPAALPVVVGAAGAVRADESTALARALEAVRAENIRPDLEFIASDELAGRDTPSAGQRIAARYIAARLERLGFAPGGGDGFFHEYTLDYDRLNPSSAVTLIAPGSERELCFGEDHFFYSDQARFDLELEAPVVFCCIGAKEDFAAVAVEGRWALCFESDEPVMRRRREARKAGAAGIVVMPRPDEHTDPFPERYRRVVERSLRGDVRYPREDGEREREGFPQLFLARRAGILLLAASTARGDADPERWVPERGTQLGIALRDVRRVDGTVEVENVCGLWPGSDPELAREVILVSAHYDHVGVRDGEIYNGADDNGSGTCGLLALAEALAVHGPLRRSVMLIWVSGEEKGLFGSRAWTEDPSLPAGSHAICNLNIDMIGRNAPDSLLITPTKARPEYNGLVRLAEENAPLEGFPVLGSCDDYWARSDHMNFSKNLGIPVAFLFSDVHEDYHEPTDTADKIDYDKIRRVVRLVMRMLDGLQSDSLAL